MTRTDLARSEAAWRAAETASDAGIAGDLRAAREWFALAIATDPASPAFFPFLAAVLRALGDPGEAAVWERLEERSPGAARRGREVLAHAEAFLATRGGDGTPPPLPAGGANAVVWVLGYKLKADGTPRRRLLRRLGVALEWAGRYPAASLLLSGGADVGTPRSEGLVMAEHLVEAGVDPARLTTENCSRETLENVLFARARLAGQGRDVVLVSEEPHLARAGALVDLTGWAASLTLAGAPGTGPTDAVEIAATYRDCLRLAGFPLYLRRAVDQAWPRPWDVPAPEDALSYRGDLTT